MKWWHLSIFLCLFSCATVHPYECQFVKDTEMDLTQDAGKNFTDYVHSIREGSTPAGSTKSSGGCGCN